MKNGHLEMVLEILDALLDALARRGLLDETELRQMIAVARKRLN